MKKTISVLVSTTHWDREWYRPFECFRFGMVSVMDNVLDTLESDPRFHSFTFDGQSIVIRDYLEIRPAARERIERLVEDGRLLFGPWYVQPDEFLVSGESLVRNMEVGIAMARDMGASMPLGYIPDMFGHIPQLPQIFRLLGLCAAAMTRGLGRQLTGKKTRTEFAWEGLDGSTMRVLYQMNGYCNAGNLGLPSVSPQETRPDPNLALEQVEREVNALARFAPADVVLLSNGCDHLDIQPEIPDLLDHVNRLSELTEVRHGSYQDYLDAVPFAPEKLAVIRGELRGAEHHFLLPGVFSARTYLKQMNDSCETLLTSYTEPLALLDWLESGRNVDGFLDYAWRLLLENHPHDSICGCSVDAVHREMEVRFDKVAQLCRSVSRDAAGRLAHREDPSGAWAVFNPSGWDVPWPVQRSSRPVLPGIRRFADSEGNRITMDVEPGSGLEPDEPIFLHRPRAGCGLEIVQVEDSAPRTGVVAGDRSLENRYLRLRAAGDGQAGVFLSDKLSGREVGPLGTFGSVGDAGDEYEFQPLEADTDPMDGDGRSRVVSVVERPGSADIVIETCLSVPRCVLGNRRKRSARRINLSFESRFRVFADHPVVHVQTRVTNRARDHKAAALFRLPGAASRIRCGTQFGELVREVNDEPVKWTREVIPPWYPFREYLVEPDSGFALFARGLLEFGTPLTGPETLLALTLWRSVGDLSRDDLPFRPGHAGPPIESPEAQCLRAMTFDYAFGMVDEDGRLGDGTSYWQAARLFSGPPLAWPCPRSQGSNPALLHVRTREVVLSSVRKLSGSSAVRVVLYNATDSAVQADVDVGFPFLKAMRTDFLGKPFMSESLSCRGHTITADMGRFEIVCIEFAMTAPDSGGAS